MDKDKTRLLGLVDRFRGQRIVVWGDFILDEYVYGKTKRISREAPVLILSYQRGEYALGGAGNSVLNIQALGGHPVPVGVIGDDPAGERILGILRRQKISGRYLIRSKRFQTPIKMRILGGEENTKKQQILRIDKEAFVPDDGPLRRKLRSNIEAAAAEASGFLISDYNYRTVKPELLKAVLPSLKKARLPVILDSRFRLLEFRGVTAATPNEPEVEEALNLEFDDDLPKLQRAGRLLLGRLGASALLITRGSRGMALFEKKRNPFLIPVHGGTDIVDVTGAGDTVISVFTLALAGGASFREAALLANCAGGIVVMKKGTATLTPQELRDAISS